MDMPGEEAMYKSGKIRISRNVAIITVCAYASSLLLVGLLCGLLPADDPSCSIEVPGPTDQPSEAPIVTTKPSMTSAKEMTTSGAGPTPSPTGPPQPWDSPRLPIDLIPSHYDIFLNIDIDNQRFYGDISIIMECKQSTDLLLLHSKELNIFPNSWSMTAVDDGADVPLKGLPRTFPENQYLIVELDEMLTVGKNYTFTIGFYADLEDGLVGLYRSSYQANGTTRYLATTFFAPTDARKAFPCFDEPAMKVTYNLTLIHQDGYIALANMPLLSNKSEEAGWTRSVFEKSVPMSTYLICFVVCDFVSKSITTNNDVLLRVWAREDAQESVDYALEKGAEVLDFYDEYFGTKFPLPKMDMIAIPDFAAGAMENWGLITYRESSLLYTPGVSSSSNQQRVCVIVAHELAHQWFGNLVTLEWWDDTWLNEGFASYVEYLGTDAAEPEWGMTDQFVSADFQTALDADALITSRPIIVDVETPDDINQQFDTISYNKGASILRMLQNFLGEDTFRKGLANYLEEFAYSNAKNTDLWRVLTAAAVEDGKEDIMVEEIMRTWTEQMNYPSINVTRDYASGFFSLSQNRFLINPAANTTTNYDDLGYIWYVPLKYTTNAAPNFTEPTLQWLEPDMESVTIDFADGTTADDWLLANVNAYGFYRVNYDETNWDLISKQLTADHTVIPISSRAALISDAFNLAVSGQLSQVTAFNLTFYLEDERDYVPWSVLNRVMGYVDLMLSRSPAYGVFTTYMRGQVEPFYNYVGWNDSAGSHLDQSGRVIAISLSCGYGNVDCVNTAIDYYAQWMADPDNNPVPPNQKSRVYCTAISAGGQEEWNFAYDEYLRTSVATEKNFLLAAMGCSRIPWILSMYLERSIDPNGDIKSQDAENVAGYVASNSVGYDLAWDFFRVNWDFYRNEYGNSIFQFSDLIESVTAHFNTEFQLQELLDFIETHPDQGTGSRAFASAVDQTRANIRWMEYYEEEVMAWLEWAVTA